MIKIQKLRSNLIRRASICGASLLVVGIITFASYSYLSSLEDESKKLDSEITTIEQNITTTTKDYKTLTTAYSLYQDIEDRQKPTDSGFDTSTQRIRTLSPIVDRIKEHYNVINFSSALADNPMLNEEDYELEFSQVFENKVNISFSVLTDEIAYAIIDDIINQVPGYMIIQSMTMEKSRDFSPEAVSEIRSGNINLSLVDVDAVLLWSTVKNKEVEEQKTNQRSGNNAPFIPPF